MNNPLPRILALLPTEEPVLVNDALIIDISAILLDTNPNMVWNSAEVVELLTYLHQKSVVELTNVTDTVVSIRNIYKGT